MIPILGRPSRPTATAYDRIAGLYDDDMGRNNPGLDVAFYLARCSGASPILELGCGTGRITLPLVESGAEVAGLDRSRPMLEELRRKGAALPPAAARRLRLYWRDMRDAWGFEHPFARVLCPFSALTYVAGARERSRLLRRIRRRLERGGLLILDVFVPQPAILRRSEGRPIRDYRRRLADGTVLQREKTIATDAARRIQIVRRAYRRIDAGGNLVEGFTTRSRIRYLPPGEMRRLLESHGFRIVEESGEFGRRPVGARTRTAAWVCQPL